MSNYNQLLSRSEVFNETRDCTVIALAMVTGGSYEDAHMVLKACGRENRRSGYMNQLLGALDWFGYQVNSKEFLPKQPNDSRYTVKSISKGYPKGTWLVVTDSHVFSMIDGDIQDWMKDRRFWIEQIIEIIKTPSVPPLV